MAKTKLPYGLDIQGLTHICDEAIKAYRGKAETNEFWMSEQEAHDKTEAHGNAVFEMAYKIYEEINNGRP